MLIDLHVTPGDLDPAELALAAAKAGLDGCVITDTHRTDRFEAYAEAFEAQEVAAYPGVELALERGFLVFIPREEDDAFFARKWAPVAGRWALKDALEMLAGADDGALVAGHPYHRKLESFLGDHVYTIRGLTAVETRVGRGKMIWNDLADEVVEKRGVARVGTCGGEPTYLGRAATIIPGDLEQQADLVDALRARSCWPVELDGLDDPRRYTPEPPPPRRDDRPRRSDSGGRGGGRDGGGRGGGRGGRSRRD